MTSKPGKPLKAGQTSLFSFFQQKPQAATPTQTRQSAGGASAAGTAAHGNKYTPVDKTAEAPAAPPKTSLFAAADTSKKQPASAQHSAAEKKATNSSSDAVRQSAQPAAKKLQVASKLALTPGKKSLTAPHDEGPPSPKKSPPRAPISSEKEQGQAKRRAAAAKSASTPRDAPSADDGEALVAKKIKVFWPQDDAWYSGRVVEFNERDRLHLVLYDDGEEDWLDFDEEDVQVLGADGGGSADSAAGAKRKSAGTAAAATKKTSKKKRQIGSDNESSEEEEYIPGKNGAADDEDDSGDDDDLQLSDEDDDEDDYAPAKKAKPARKPAAQPKVKARGGGSSGSTADPKALGSPFLARNPTTRTPGAKSKASGSCEDGKSAASAAVTDAAAAAGESSPGVLNMGAHVHNHWPWLNAKRYVQYQLLRACVGARVRLCCCCCCCCRRRRRRRLCLRWRCNVRVLRTEDLRPGSQRLCRTTALAPCPK
jgi:hypothetical protein